MIPYLFCIIVPALKVKVEIHLGGLFMINIACLTTGLATNIVSNLLEVEINTHGSTLQKAQMNQKQGGSMVRYKDKDVKAETVSKKVYMIIDGEKVYIDPEIVKRYNLQSQKVSFFTGRKLYVEED